MIFCALFPAAGVEVSRVEFQVSGGSTREQALRRWTSVSEGQVFGSDEDLQAAADRDVQELINLEVFLSVDAEIKADPQNTPDGRVVTFNITDATTFVPVPLPLYDSNSGGVQLLYVQIWDNMFGTLSNWFSLAMLTLRKDEDGRIETGPWMFMPQVSKLKINNFEFAVRYEQERSESQKYNASVLSADYRFDKSALFLTSTLRFGEQRRLYYSVEPGAIFRYSYTDFAGLGNFDQTPFEAQLYQSLAYDSRNVFFNSRKGTYARVSNTLRLISRNGELKPAADITARASVYLAFGEQGRISYYSRVLGQFVFGDSYEQLGMYMRGIPDATMDGTIAVYLNQTVGFDVWEWPGVWDLQIHPFFDLGFAVSRNFSGPDDLRRSAGADILLFIEKVPNLAFRFTWGTDLNRDVKWGSDNKTEFIVRYSFSY